MKCEKCGSEWSVSDAIKSKISQCPFCGANISKEEQRTIIDVLIEWGKKEGLDFFRNSVKSMDFCLICFLKWDGRGMR